MTKPSSLITVVSLGIAGLALCGQAHADLINHWQFDEAAGTTVAADSAGSLNLALQGNADFVYDATRGGQVLSLDGADDYASNAVEPFTSDITHTLAVWVKHSDAGKLTQKWVSWGTASGRYFFGPRSNGDGWIFAGIGNQILVFNEAGAIPSQDVWQYWTLVRDGSNATLYRDGLFVQTLSAANTVAMSTDGEFRVGCQYNTAEFLHGYIDDLAIWSEALTQEQIISAMNYGAANYMIPEPSSAVLLSFAVMAMLLGLGSRRRVIG